MYNKYKIARSSSEYGNIKRTSTYDEVMGEQYTEIYTLPNLIEYINADEINLSFFFLIENGQIVYDSFDDISIALINLGDVGDEVDEKSYESVVSNSEAIFDSVASFITYLNSIESVLEWAVVIDQKKKRLIPMEELL